MLSKRIQTALAGSSAIRAMFVEGKELAAKVGEENVFDFSLGNPATPAPESLKQAMKDLLDDMDPLVLHGYMSNAGYEDVRAAIAENLNSRFGTDFTWNNIVMTVGAAGGINIVFKTILDPGDEVIVFAPFFGEYKSYAANFDAAVVTVAPDYKTFQPDLDAFAASFTEKTKAVIVNTPNNPTGVIYSDETMTKIGEILRSKEEEYQKEIYLISDEPYRELIYDGAEENFLTKYYHNTIVGYSFSKSLSLPGERIGYIAVPNEVTDAEQMLAGIEVANRTLGFVNAPSLIQKAAAACVNEKTNLEFYDKNRIDLYEGLKKLGFTCIKPQGAFYLWLKSPVEDEAQFVAAAKKYNLILVKGSAFGCSGYVRLAYCISNDKINRSLDAFAKLANEYGLGV
ncbi:MAG: pyridoxal phosphate-dependent aminotransferase [Lachnospiraceae bacterium]|nr:pyridoxal phosphate-dependent aminotransferase [Lachnospiraceae bacterium]